MNASSDKDLSNHKGEKIKYEAGNEKWKKLILVFECMKYEKL